CRQLDIDAFDRVGVFTHAVKRDDHIFVDLERVCVAGNGGSARAVQPEFFTRFGADGDKAFAMARVGDSHDFAGSYRYSVGIVTDDIADKDHFRQAAALAFGCVADGAQVALVQVFESSQDGAAFAAGTVEIVFDLNNGRYGIARLPEKFHTDGARVGRHAMQYPARRGDQAVTAFFLHAGHASEELVGNVFAKASLAEARTVDFQDFAAQRQRAGLGFAVRPLQFEACFCGIVDFAQVVIQAGDIQPIAIGVDHAPAGQVVQGGAPQHRFFAAGVHGDVAARTGSVG